MKNLIKISLVAAAVAATFPFTVAAQTSGTAPAAAPAVAAPAAGAHHPKMHRAMMKRRAALHHRIVRQLHLNATQKTQLKTIRQNTAASLKALRANTSLTPEQRKAQAHQLLAAAHTQMRGVLTPEQQTKLHRMKARVREQMGAFGGL